MRAVYRLMLVLALAAIAMAAYPHNTGTPHREFTAEELRELGLEDLIVTSSTAIEATASGNFTIPVNGPINSSELWYTWGLDPGVLISLALAGGLYWLGVRRLWRVTHVGGGITKLQASWYALGWIWLVIALVSPLHPWGEVLFSAHMVQHELLMLVAAPLLIMGRPVIAMLWALPPSWRQWIGKAGSTGWWRQVWSFTINPFVAWLVHAIILWVWHIPSWFQTTLTSDWIHSLQHSSFLFSALLFWFAVLHGRQRELGYGMAVLYLFTTAIHSGALGALLTFTTTLWYPAYADTAVLWGLSPLEDQQLGGLIMWVPAGLVYIATGLALFIGWLTESERRALVHDAQWLATHPPQTSPAAATNAGGMP